MRNLLNRFQVSTVLKMIYSGYCTHLSWIIRLMFLLSLFNVNDAAQRFHIIEKKLIQNACSSDETVRLYLPDNGLKSAFKLYIYQDFWASSKADCTINIHTHSSGVILHLDYLYSIENLHGLCNEYIEVSDNRLNSTKLCGFEKSTFVSNGSVEFRYQSVYTGMRAPAFSIIATAYNTGKECEGFICGSGECIWSGFVCDGIINCPDGLDENSIGDLSCIDVPNFTLKSVDLDLDILIKPAPGFPRSFSVVATAVIGSAMIILIFGTILFLWYHYYFHIRRSQFSVSLNGISGTPSRLMA